jgi:hypothetical protein
MRVPQWMFDATALGDWRLADRPAVSSAALVDLQGLLSSMSRQRDEHVLQAEHPSQDDAGENDAELIQAAASGAIEVVPPDPEVAELVGTAAGGAPTDAPVAGATAAGSDTARSRAGFRRGAQP